MQKTYNIIFGLVKVHRTVSPGKNI